MLNHDHTHSSRYSDKTNEELWPLFQAKNDKHAIQEIVSRLHRELFAVCSRKLLPPHLEPEDIVSECIVKVLEEREQLPPWHPNVRALFFKMMDNIYLNEITKYKRRQGKNSIIAGKYVENSASCIEANFLKWYFQEVIRKVKNPRYRKHLLGLLEGLNSRDIADELGEDPKKISKEIHKARTVVKKEIKKSNPDLNP